jgi:hypothetical protein
MLIYRVATAAGILFIPSVSPALGQSWEQLCLEGASCKVHGTRPIRYGAEGRFNYGVATGSVQFEDKTFGDPTPNVSKRCDAYYTLEETATRKSLRSKDDRIRALEQELQAKQAQLDEVNAEVTELHRELRDRRGDARDRRDLRERRGRDQFGPFIIERR